MVDSQIELAVSLYLYHTDMWAEIYSLLKKITIPYKIYIGLCLDTTNAAQEISIKEDLLESNIPYKITHHSNHGSDTSCFLDHLNIMSEPYFIKIHSKKSKFSINSQIDWCAVLMNDLIGNNNIVQNNLNRLKSSKTLGMLCNKENIIDNYESTNKDHITEILENSLNIKRSDIKIKKFAAGTMFMSKLKLFKNVFDSISINKIQLLLQQNRGKLTDELSGTYAHALERIFGYIIYHQKHNIKHVVNRSVSIYSEKYKAYHDLVIIYNQDCYIRNFIGTYGKVIYELKEESYTKYTVLWYDNFGTVKTYRVNNQTLSENSFDPNCYASRNADLNKMTPKQLHHHFHSYGLTENRNYTINLPNNKTYKQTKHDFVISLRSKYKNIKQSLILINHDTSLSGAPIFLHNLYNYLIENTMYDKDKIFFMNACPDNNFFTHQNEVYHFNDINILKYIFKILNVTCIYSNSLNFYAANLSSFPEYADKTFLHFHEEADYIHKWMTAPHAQPVPAFKPYSLGVVSKQIKDKLSEYSIFDSQIHVCPPFLSQSKIDNILKQSKQKPTNNIDLNIDFSKPIIFMCGSLCLRKNPKLLLDVARLCPEYEFLWIGGNDEKLPEQLAKLYNIKPPSLTQNFHWVPHTQNPYYYMNLCDYLFVTSEVDPCPTIVLEALILNKKVFVLQNKVLTNYECDSCYYLNSNNLESIIADIKKINPTKYSKNNIGKNFVQNSFGKPNIKPIEKIIGKLV